jgi:hypothetical protein
MVFLNFHVSMLTSMRMRRNLIPPTKQRNRMTKFLATDTKAQGEDPKDSSANSPKDFTTAIPMVDLSEAVKIVNSIYENGLEDGSMDTVAKKLGYAAATSSPFYYRIRAARLFGLLSSKSALSEKAKDYIKPHEEGMRATILADAIMGIPDYAELVKRYNSKKLNIELLGHWIAKERKLTDACALTCAKAFESSLRFAGMLSDDGSVGSARTKPVAKEESETAVPPVLPALPAAITVNNNSEDSTDTLTQTMYLDKSKSRKVTVTSPTTVTVSEYERVCKWLDVVIMVEDKKEDATS